MYNNFHQPNLLEYYHTSSRILITYQKTPFACYLSSKECQYAKKHIASMMAIKSTSILDEYLSRMRNSHFWRALRYEVRANDFKILSWSSQSSYNGVFNFLIIHKTIASTFSKVHSTSHSKIHQITIFIILRYHLLSS